MKRLPVFAIALAMAFVVIAGTASAEEMRPAPIDSVLADIRREMGIGAADRIDPDAVPLERLQELGDSVMEAAIGNPAMHDRMDDRLGGDGSATLNAYHADLATRYLKGEPIGWMGGMRGGRMGRPDFGGSGGFPVGVQTERGCANMMGFGIIGMLFGGLLLAGLLALLVFGVVLAARGSTRASEHPQASQEDHSKARVMALLAERYAKGEIDDAEYRRKKCELQ